MYTVNIGPESVKKATSNPGAIAFLGKKYSAASTKQEPL